MQLLTEFGQFYVGWTTNDVFLRSSIGDWFINQDVDIGIFLEKQN